MLQEKIANYKEKFEDFMLKVEFFKIDHGDTVLKTLQIGAFAAAVACIPLSITSYHKTDRSNKFASEIYQANTIHEQLYTPECAPHTLETPADLENKLAALQATPVYQAQISEYNASKDADTKKGNLYLGGIIGLGFLGAGLTLGRMIYTVDEIPLCGKE